LPKEWVLQRVDPKEVEIKLKGPRTSFYLNIKERIKFYPRFKMQTGPQRVRVYATDFSYPKGLVMDDYDPHYISIILGRNKKDVSSAEEVNSK
jgi:hypothetical protein